MTENISEILFNLASADRLTLLSEISNRKQRLTDLSKVIDASALWIEDKMFAALTSKGKFIVKIPRQKIDALISSGEGARYDPGHGRLMKEWLSLELKSETGWLPLTGEAMEFVASKR